MLPGSEAQYYNFFVRISLRKVQQVIEYGFTIRFLQLFA